MIISGLAGPLWRVQEMAFRRKRGNLIMFMRPISIITLLVMILSFQLIFVTSIPTSENVLSLSSPLPLRTDPIPNKGIVTSIEQPEIEWVFHTSGRVADPPTAFDIDNDGTLEIFVGSWDRNFYALSSNGSLLWNYTTEPMITIEGVSTMATVADINSDGTPEVLFGALDGYLYALNAMNGSLLWRYKTNEWIAGASPAAARLDDSGETVVLFGAQEGLFCLYGNNGSLRWNYTTEYPVCSSPAVADVDNDGHLEVVFGSNEDLVRSLGLENGDLEWTTLLIGGNSVVWSNPVVVDVDRDGIMEIFVVTLAGQVFSLSGDAGVKTLIASFPDAEGSPVIADVDNDGQLEILVVEFYGSLYCYNALTGVIEWMSVIERIVKSAPAIADVDLDGNLEVIVGANSFDDNLLLSFDGTSGTREWSFPVNKTGHSSPMVADIDLDGNQEIVFGSGNDILCITIERSNAYAYEWSWIGDRGGAGTTGNWTDSDGDNLTDTYEGFVGSNPHLSDSDGDGLSDSSEFAHSTNPNDPDTDSDGMPDGWEVVYGLDPIFPNDATQDRDLDGLSNLQEYEYGTNPTTADSDDDDLDDIQEITVYFTDPLNNDTDYDELSDGSEVLQHSTDPLNNDTDSDEMPDGWEVQNGLNPLVDDASEDLDSDGLLNLLEYQTGTLVNDSDSDSDGIPDGWEVAYGYDPLDSIVPPDEILIYHLPGIIIAAIVLLSIIASYNFRKRFSNLASEGTDDSISRKT